MNPTTCLLPSRMWKVVLRADSWSAEECAHLADCPACRQRLRETTESAKAPAQDRLAYPAVSPSVRRSIDVAVVQAVLDLDRPEDIRRSVQERFRIDLTEDQIREIMQKARKSGNLVYRAENDLDLEQRLCAEFGLRTARVVRCSGKEPVVRWAADSLRNIFAEVRESRLTVRKTPAVRVGVAGGPTGFEVMARYGEQREEDGFDVEVTVDALVPGAFWLHMSSVRPTWTRVQFHDIWEQTRHLKETNHGGHYIPPMIERSVFWRLMANEKGVQDTVRSVNDLDVIVSSGAVWDDDHGALQLKAHYPDPQRTRRDHDIRAEFLWHPINERRPVGVDLVPVTSLGPEGLDRLPDLIRKGKRVLAVLAPCVVCGLRKMPLLRALLSQEQPLITDVVVDAVSAEEALENQSRKSGTFSAS